jgi:uncharacterized protein YcaQ
MGAQGLLDDPKGPVTAASLAKFIKRLGFVQLDSINVVERAHNLTLHSRMDEFKQEQFTDLMEKERSLFEHWTHDASAIPMEWFPHWKPRFRKDLARIQGNAWWQYHFRGVDGDQVVAGVLERITNEGPLKSADFEHPEKRGPWWGWKPQKAALDFLWRTGQLAIVKRIHFQKVYDLTKRVLPTQHFTAEPNEDAHIHWACSSALERLSVASSKEIADFWAVLDVAQIKAWFEREATAGRIMRVNVESADGSKPRAAFAVADWETRLKNLPEAPVHMRLLCPFDPVLRDRARASRLFGFDYRFEAFVPESKRAYGYYVLPILEGEKIVGRLDPKFHRNRSLLEVKGLWWESAVKTTKARKRALEAAIERLAVFIGAADVHFPK